MDLRALFIGLSTVFAWTPATILVALGLFGLISAFVNISEVPFQLTLSLIFVGLGSLTGYIGISAVCWGIKLKSNLILVCLIIGALTLTFVIIMGATSPSKVLHIGLNVEDIYLFVSPLIFIFIHVFLNIYQNHLKMTD
jgi:hypothetical protein